jgi:mannosyltransferase OCH1-like enzyme
MENDRRDAVFPSEFLGAANERELNLTALIPKIIHQTYKTEEIPEHWMAGQQAVQELHQDWEYMVISLFPFLLLEYEESIRKRLIKSSSGQTTKLTPSSHPTTPPSC